MSRIPSVFRRWRTIALWGWVGICLGSFLLGTGLRSAHGLKCTGHLGERQVLSLDHWPWLYVDQSSVRHLTSLTGSEELALEGSVWQGEPGRTTWRVVHHGALELFVGDALVLADAEVHEARSDEVEVCWSGDSVPVRLVIQSSHESIGDLLGYQVELLEPNGWGGWRQIRREKLYPEPPTGERALSDSRLATLRRFGLLGLVLTAVGWVVRAGIRRVRSGPRHAWLVGGAVLLAFLVRGLVLIQRGESDPRFWSLGADNYVTFARVTLAGRDLVAGGPYSPGNTWWFLGWMSLLGPDLWKLYLVNTVVAASSVGALTRAALVAWNRRVAVGVGLLAALYPPLVFYQTSLQIASIGSSLVAFTILAAVCVWRSPSAWQIAVLGFLIGVGALVRPTVLVFLPGIVLGLLCLLRSGSSPAWGKRRTALAILVLFLGSAAAVLPQTVFNYAKSRPSLISSNGPINLLIGNNREASGSYRITEAVKTGRHWARRTEHTLVDAAWREVRRDPSRALRLQLRKLALFFRQSEVASDLSYRRQGLGSSSWLRVSSLNGLVGMRALSWVFFLGLIAILASRGRARPAVAWALVLLGGLYVAGTVPFIVDGRIRSPLAPFMILLGVAGIDRLLARPRSLGKVLVPIVSSALLIVAVAWGERNLLPKEFSRSLPEDAISRTIEFPNGVRLLGYRETEGVLSPAGYVNLELYWEVAREIKKNYTVELTAFDESAGTERWSFTYELGTVGFPRARTSGWKPGGILAESYLIPIPKDSPPELMVRARLVESNSGRETDEHDLVRLGIE